MWLPKQELNDDTACWEANMGGKLHEAPLLDEKTQAITAEGDLVFPRDEPPNGYPIPSGQS